jgi:DNA-binding CsgD family transcriptional regulator
MSSDSQLLSEREIEILELVSTGMTNRQVALKLGISANTVKAHLRNIFGKLEVESRTEATRYAIAHQLVHIRGLDAAASSLADDEALAPDPLAAYRASIPRWQQVGAFAFAIIVGLGVALWPRNPTGDAQASKDFSDGAQAQATGAMQDAPRWRAETTLPEARSRFAQAAIGSRLYLIAGETERGVVADVHAYNLDTGAWQQAPAKPTAVANVRAAVIGDRIYVPGGLLADGRPTDVMEVFDPRAGTWSEAAPLPKPTLGYALAADGDGFWICGGWDGSQYVADCFHYRASKDAWEPAPTLGTARAFAAGAWLDGRVYVTGGFDGNTVYRLAESFAPTSAGEGTREWQIHAPMQAPRAGHEAVALEGALYVIGGGWDAPLSYGERYDPVANAWATFPSPVLGSWRNLGLSAVARGQGGMLYAAGGWNDGYLQTVQAFQATYRLYFPVEKGGSDE